MILFYTDEIDDTHCYLNKDEHRHCTKVLRKKVGDIVICTNGKGIQLTARISDIKKTHTELNIIEQNLIAPIRPALHIAVALPKSNSRVDMLVEKLVETGTQEITPILTAHSERKTLNLERYRKKLISAATQSLKYHFPLLNEPMTLSSILESNTDSDIIIAHYKDTNKDLAELIKSKQDILLIIGPEGDFSSAEMDLFASKNFPFVNLSPYRLRTETAAIAASVIFNARF